MGGVVVYTLVKKDEPKKKERKPKTLKYAPTELNGLQIDLRVGDTLEIASAPGEVWSLATNAPSVEESSTDVNGVLHHAWRIHAVPTPGAELPQSWGVNMEQAQPSTDARADFTVKFR